MVLLIHGLESECERERESERKRENKSFFQRENKNKKRINNKKAPRVYINIQYFCVKLCVFGVHRVDTCGGFPPITILLV